MNNIDEIKEELKFTTKGKASYQEILTDDTKAFLCALHENFKEKRVELLNSRKLQQELFDGGSMPQFPPETKVIRESDWTASKTPNDLLDRRVEITGPVDRKMVINALNSDAKTFMADFEDSNSPSWENCMEGQINLRDANRGTISYYNKTKKKLYELKDRRAILIVRPRGLHLNERHILINGEEISASLVDFGLYVFHNTKILLEKGTAPYFYLPKLEHYLEARWWNEVFEFAQDYLNIPNGTFKTTVLIETITASFQLDEIIYELREHIVGLNCGRWDYIFSYIKKFRNHESFVVPNRDQVTMKAPFMSAYSKLVIQRCHKRGIHAMGGMAAQIPIKEDVEANDQAIEKVRLDKELEAKNGHDGTWVAHPGLVEVALQEFDKYMPTPNQIHVKLEDLVVTEQDLIEVPTGTITEEGIRKNINVGVLYLEAWLRGNGAVALYNLMEDAATAEISRTQIWQWLKHGVKLDDCRLFNKELYVEIFKSETKKIMNQAREGSIENTKYSLAFTLFNELILSDKFEEFLTLNAYQYI